MRTIRTALYLLPLCLLAVTAKASTISISAVDGADTFYDLTGTYGTLDWAYWEQTASPLTAPVAPSNEKALANFIGSISAVGGGGVRGSSSPTKPPYDFSFTDGTSPTSGSVSNLIGLFNTNLNTTDAGVQLNVLAPSADPFTIYLWGTAYSCTGVLTATVGSASDTNSELTNPAGSRSPGKLYTITVVPDSAGQAVNLKLVLASGTDTFSNAEISAVGVAVPEPSTLLLAGLAVLGLAAYGWRWKTRRA